MKRAMKYRLPWLMDLSLPRTCAHLHRIKPVKTATPVTEAQQGPPLVEERQPFPSEKAAGEAHGPSAPTPRRPRAALTGLGTQRTTKLRTGI